MNVSDSIKKLSEEKDLTQEQFGEIAGVSSMAVSQWENGRAVPRMGAIQRISDYFGIPKSTIMGDEPQKAQPSDIGIDLSPEEHRLLDLFRKMDDENRARFLDAAGVYVAASEKYGAGNREDVERAGIAVM